jgi:hypothetical protein
MNPVLLKDDSAIPDAYGITVSYVTGKVDEIEAASHRLIDTVKDIGKTFGVMPSPFFEIWKTDDTMMFVPVQSIAKIEFDRRFSKLVEIKNKSQKTT